MADLVVILGSGFSKPAGLPLAKEINSYFERDNARTILKYSSGESKWMDFANDTYKHNGESGYDHLAYGILLNEFVRQYISDRIQFINYEDFYQYVVDNLYNEEIIETIKKKALISFKTHFPHIEKGHYYDNYTHAINHFQPREFKSLINHLIDDLLYVRNPIEEVKLLYKEFIDFCKKYDTIDFITLNHDLLLERLIQEYSDGFTKDQKILKSSTGESLNLFQASFSKKINLIKLHGSIDTYRYIVAKQEGSIITPTGESLFFKTHDYNEKQSPVRYDQDSGEEIQTFHWEIDPQFITGTRKKEIFSSPGMYKTLFEESENRICGCKTILIIGYSLGDEHVNEAIELAILASDLLEKIIVVNPSKKIPFDVTDIENHHLNAINELKTLL